VETMGALPVLVLVLVLVVLTCVVATCQGEASVTCLACWTGHDPVHNQCRERRHTSTTWQGNRASRAMSNAQCAAHHPRLARQKCRRGRSIDSPCAHLSPWQACRSLLYFWPPDVISPPGPRQRTSASCVLVKHADTRNTLLFAAPFHTALSRAPACQATWRHVRRVARMQTPKTRAANAGAVAFHALCQVLALAPALALPLGARPLCVEPGVAPYRPPAIGRS
jgi:hypothetical protein